MYQKPKKRKDMVKSFLNETKIGNKSKNRVRKEKKKKDLWRIGRDCSYKKEESFMNLGLNEIALEWRYGLGVSPSFQYAPYLIT